uniref:Bestrophin homolog n=1 Tax=Parascaris univalens TaxID=6257 RepID=A0A915A6U2_PARUN
MQDPGTCPSSTRSTSTLNEQSSPASTTTESVSSKSEYGESEKVAPRVASRHVHLPPRPGTVRVNNVRRTRNERDVMFVTKPKFERSLSQPTQSEQVDSEQSSSSVSTRGWLTRCWPFVFVIIGSIFAVMVLVLLFMPFVIYIQKYL